MEDITLKEVQKERDKCVQAIKNAVETFHKSTGVIVTTGDIETIYEDTITGGKHVINVIIELNIKI